MVNKTAFFCFIFNLAFKLTIYLELCNEWKMQLQECTSLELFYF